MYLVFTVTGIGLCSSSFFFFNIRENYLVKGTHIFLKWNIIFSKKNKRNIKIHIKNKVIFDLNWQWAKF